MSVCSRFKIDSHYNDDHETVAVARVADQGVYPFESERFPLVTEADKYGVCDRTTHSYSTPSKRDMARQQCIDWLNANYPDHGNPSAYWD